MKGDGIGRQLQNKVRERGDALVDTTWASGHVREEQGNKNNSQLS